MCKNNCLRAFHALKIYKSPESTLTDTEYHRFLGTIHESSYSISQDASRYWTFCGYQSKLLFKLKPVEVVFCDLFVIVNQNYH